MSKAERVKISENRWVSLANIPYDLRQLGLSESIIDRLIQNGVFFVSQVRKMTEFELCQLDGISPDAAEIIKNAFYRYRWRTHVNKNVQNLQEFKALIEASAKKKEILAIPLNRITLPKNAFLYFSGANINTVGEMLKLNDFEIMQIKGMGRYRYHELINSLLMALTTIKADILSEITFLPKNPLDYHLFTKPDLTFPEVFTCLLNVTKPRNREIFFSYYFGDHPAHKHYNQLARQYHITRERVRQICSRELRVLCRPECIKCLTTFLNTVWKHKVYDFVMSQGSRVTRSALEQEFAHELPEINLIQTEILNIDDIWANFLLKAEQFYYLPHLPEEKIQKIEQLIVQEIMINEWEIDGDELIRRLERKISLSPYKKKAQAIFNGIIHHFSRVEVIDHQVRLVMLKK